MKNLKNWCLFGAVMLLIYTCYSEAVLPSSWPSINLRSYGKSISIGYTALVLMSFCFNGLLSSKDTKHLIIWLAFQSAYCGILSFVLWLSFSMFVFMNDPDHLLSLLYLTGAEVSVIAYFSALPLLYLFWRRKRRLLSADDFILS